MHAEYIQFWILYTKYIIINAFLSKWKIFKTYTRMELKYFRKEFSLILPYIVRILKVCEITLIGLRFNVSLMQIIRREAVWIGAHNDSNERYISKTWTTGILEKYKASVERLCGFWHTYNKFTKKYACETCKHDHKSIIILKYF